VTTIRVIVQGPVGCGKSAIAGEIEIALRAIGVPVSFADALAMRSEKNMTHADWTSAIEMYRPTVIIEERINKDPTMTDTTREAVVRAIYTNIRGKDFFSLDQLANKVSSNAADDAIAAYERARSEPGPTPETVFKAVERILDECSAWVARPNEEVTRRVAFAATCAAWRHFERVPAEPSATHEETARELIRNMFCSWGTDYSSAHALKAIAAALAEAERRGIEKGRSDPPNSMRYGPNNQDLFIPPPGHRVKTLYTDDSGRLVSVEVEKL
jgi:hypothetical protein